ncbi:bactofilin family protein [Altericroceibacterium endophyticum]|uniref:Polymer-forming cytoskeletal protein n=1 Tax=Altericroceibacterium endophyticum TaxID=1808508 RepID=A0A6I4T4A4_9SPHN|nr:polymer-forming cytoskeletal protein [Altericroceibacterium endophyticum]MXO65686.1 polymer-forming cytoskeletal protein [Altericroceibacterium endophyticum]
MTKSATFSIIGPDVTLKGNIEAGADLHIDGSVEGDVTCAALIQGASGNIEGSITADSARLAGEVSGSVKAAQLVILKSARLHGDVEYETLTIEQGASVEGRFVPMQTEQHSDQSHNADKQAHLILAK